MRCFLRDERVPELAKSWGTTRSAAAVSLWEPHLEGAVVAIGNAPTALFHLMEMLIAGAPRPAAIVGCPVGFIGAAESKDALVSLAEDHGSTSLRDRPRAPRRVRDHLLGDQRPGRGVVTMTPPGRFDGPRIGTKKYKKIGKARDTHPRYASGSPPHVCSSRRPSNPSILIDVSTCRTSNPVAHTIASTWLDPSRVTIPFCSIRSTGAVINSTLERMRAG